MFYLSKHILPEVGLIQTRLADDVEITLVFMDKRKPHWQEALYSVRWLQLCHVLIGDGETFQSGQPLRVHPCDREPGAKES